MSKQALDLLHNLDLINREGSVADLATFSDHELLSKLETYTRVRREGLDEEIQKVKSDSSMFSTLVSSVSAPNAVLALLPSALVYDRVYTDDPVFPHGFPLTDYTRSASQLFGFSNNESIDRVRIAKKLKYFADLDPLIRSGVLCSLPISYLHKSPSELPVYFSEDGFNSEVPDHIRNFVHEEARINQVKIDSETGGMTVHLETPQKPTRMVSISFNGDYPVGPGMLFFLTDIENVGKGSGSQIRVKQTFDPNNIPLESTYRAWVNQSINRTILGRLGIVAGELNLAEKLQAAYMTQSSFESKLFSLSTDKSLPATSRETAVNFLRATTPFLSVDSPEMVAKIRGDNKILFDKFHVGMLQIASQLTGIESDFEEKAKQLYMKEVEPQVQAINFQLEKARAQVGAGLITAASATAVALLKMTSLPFVSELTVLVGAGAAGVLANSLPTIQEYIAKKRTPAFIWSQLAKK